MEEPARSTRTLVVALLVVLVGLTARPAQAQTYTAEQYAARLLELVNQARAVDHLVALRLASGTGTVAHAWSEHLAAQGALEHNPDLQQQLEAHGSPDWGVFGENVGKGDPRDPDGLFDAYMASPDHRENVLTPEYRYLGNEIVFGGAWAWNTMDFVDSYGTAKPSASPKPEPRPRATSAPPRATTGATRTTRATAGSRPSGSTSSPAPASTAPRSTTSSPPAPRTASSPVVAVTAPAPEASAAASPAAGRQLDAAAAPAPARRPGVLPVALAAVLLLLVSAGWIRAATRRWLLLRGQPAPQSTYGPRPL